MNDALKLLKLDLGHKSNAKDEYYTEILKAVKKELKERKGITINLEDVNDKMLLVDIAAWKIRNRDKGENLPENLVYAIRSRSLRERSKKCRLTKLLNSYPQ